MKNLSYLLLVLLCACTSLAAFSQTSTTSCSGTRRVITPWGDGGIYFSGKPGGFNYQGFQPGDTLVLRAQLNTWSYFSLEDVHGTVSCPIVIINEGGQVHLTKGIDLRNCSNIKLTGSGSADQYGIKVHNPDDWDNNGVAIGIQGRSRNIEVERIFVHKKTYGAWIKQDPQCADSLNYPSFRMDNIKMHDCRFLNIGQDCIYAGNTDPTGNRPVWCNGVETHPVPMRLSNIQIYNNYVDSCNRTGIQLSGCDEGYNAIYNNYVTRCGYELNQQQGCGISIGGMTRNTYVYNNTIRQTFLYGIIGLGVGTNYIENNDIDSSGYLGTIVNTYSQPTAIYIDTRQSLPYDSSRYVIKNNIVGKNASGDGHDIYWEKSYNSYAGGNVMCNNKKRDNVTPAVIYTRPGISWTSCPASTPAVNIPPTVNAGADKTITLPVSFVTLSGTGADSDGTIAAYSWTKISGPASFAIAAATSAQTNITALVQGVYLFELKVTDNGGLTAKDTVKVTVNAATVANVLPVVNAGADQTITLPANSLTLAGTATDSDGSIVGWEWTKASGPVSFSLATPNAAQTLVNSLVEGIYTFVLKVTDNSGAVARDTVKVTVNALPALPVPANIAPVATAGTDQNITLPVNSVILTGTATDADGNIASMAWTKISGPAQYSIVTPNGSQTTVSNLAQGVYLFEYTAYDNQGAAGRDTVSVTVNAAPQAPVNKAPVANAGADKSISLPQSSVVLSGSGTDVDGSIVAYRWVKISGSNCTISPSNAAQTTIGGLSQGTYTFELMVTDNQGATGRDTVVVKVAKQTRKASSALVYPTLTTSTLNLRIDAATQRSQTMVRIFDQAGALVHEEAFVREQESVQKMINVSRLKPGAYFLQVNTDINEQTSLKFIKQ